MYLDMQLEELYRLSNESNSLEIDDLLDIVDELTDARFEIMLEHVKWYVENNHESIKKSYHRSQIIYNILS